MGQRDIRNRGVEHLHKGCEHDRQSDKPGIETRPPFLWLALDPVDFDPAAHVGSFRFGCRNSCWPAPGCYVASNSNASPAACRQAITLHPSPLVPDPSPLVPDPSPLV